METAILAHYGLAHSMLNNLLYPVDLYSLFCFVIIKCQNTIYITKLKKVVKIDANTIALNIGMYYLI